jgi:hypothetical protein
MDRKQVLDGLDFDDDGFIDQQIEAVAGLQFNILIAES